MAGRRDYITQDFVYAPPGVTVGDVLSAYVMRGAHWWWLLVVQSGTETAMCTFGSLLPYLLGLTPHIVHTAGACPICETLDRVLWRDTERLIAQALADPRIRSRLVDTLPMKPIPVADIEQLDKPDFFTWLLGERKGMIYGVREVGVFVGVMIEHTRTMGGLGGNPSVPAF